MKRNLQEMNKLAQKYKRKLLASDALSGKNSLNADKTLHNSDGLGMRSKLKKNIFNTKDTENQHMYD